MPKVELIEINFGLGPRESGRSNRVSNIVVRMDNIIRRMTFAEPLVNTRTIRKEEFKIIDGQIAKAGSQVSIYNAVTRQLELREVEVFPQTENAWSYSRREEYDSGKLLRELVIQYGSDGRPRFYREKIFSPITDHPLKVQEAYLEAPVGSVCLSVQTFDPHTGELIASMPILRTKPSTSRERIGAV